MERIRSMEFLETFDTVVAIANGGIIPAALINQRLGVDFQLMKVSLRNASQTPMFASPRLLEPLGFDPEDRSILLVEDRVKTGASLRFALGILENRAKIVKTCAVNGPADYSLFDTDCFRFPWIIGS